MTFKSGTFILGDFSTGGGGETGFIVKLHIDAYNSTKKVHFGAILFCELKVSQCAQGSANFKKAVQIGELKPVKKVLKALWERYGRGKR